MDTFYISGIIIFCIGFAVAKIHSSYQNRKARAAYIPPSDVRREAKGYYETGSDKR